MTEPMSDERRAKIRRDWEDWRIDDSAIPDLLAENDRLRVALDRVRASRAEHPECAVHPGEDVVSCGWKSVVLDIDAALRESV